MTPSALEQKVAGAGVGLGNSAIQWGRRPAVARGCRLVDRDLRLLAFLHDFGYASTSVLAALFWGRLTTVVNERLKLLHDVGLLDKLRPAVARSEGSAECIYRLTSTGWRTILDAGMAADGEDYTPAVLTSISYVEHDLQVAALVCRLAALAATAIEADGPLIDAAPFRLLGPRSGTIDQLHETRATDASAAAQLGERIVHTERSAPGILKPDATLLGVDGHGQRTAVMIEFDRTRRAAKQLNRLRRYDYFLTAGWRASRYAILDIEPAVLVVCTSRRQLGSFVRAADEQLTAWIADRPTQRRNAEHPGREQVAFTSREHLLAADWRMLQVPALPPSLRPAPKRGRAVLQPRAASLMLDRLFVPSF